MTHPHQGTASGALKTRGRRAVLTRAEVWQATVFGVLTASVGDDQHDGDREAHNDRKLCPAVRHSVIVGHLSSRVCRDRAHPNPARKLQRQSWRGCAGRWDTFWPGWRPSTTWLTRGDLSFVLEQQARAPKHEDRRGHHGDQLCKHRPVLRSLSAT